jgi:colanic acid biosynthesis glycosyl transferase WcaI
MRVLLLSQWFEPEPTFKGLAFARALAARGHDVEVLTGFPNYPGGNLYPGYRVRPWQRETMRGIRVTRVAIYPSHNKSALGRSLNYLSFGVTSALLSPFLVRKPDVIYVYHPPATSGLAALLAKALAGVPFVYDIQDLWPDTLGLSGMVSHSGLCRLLGRYCQLIYQRAARITVSTPGFKHALVSRGVSAEKVEVVYNWCDEAALGNSERDEAVAERLGLHHRFNIMFAGTMGTGQALGAVLEAARLCAADCPEAQFVFVGGGIEKQDLEARAKGAQLTNVLFLPRQPMEKMAAILQMGDVLLVHLKDEPLFQITIPSKTQAYMAAGRPILMSVRGDAADLVRSAKAGLVCEPENPAKIASAVRQFSKMPPSERSAMGTEGQRFYRAQLSLAVGVEKFERIFEESRQGSCGERLSKPAL